MHLNYTHSSNLIVGEVWLSDWNIRKAVLGERTKKLVRWAIYLQEMAQRKLCERRIEAAATQLNVTINAVEIFDMDGFNKLQHGCISCKIAYI